MAEEIINGAGGAKIAAKVDSKHRLHTHGISETIVEEASINGNAFNINTGTLALTSANESALLYFKNIGLSDVHIAAIGYLIGNSTGGTGDFLTTIVDAPTLGTVISDASIVPINKNKNVGSSNTLDVLAYKGGEGKTITDGGDLYYSLLPGAARSYVISTGTLVIPKGGAIGIKVTPQTSNTATNIQVFLSVIEYALD